MKKITGTVALMILFYAGFAQAPEDVLRYSYLPQHGSARSMAIGGAMGSLGGDISTLFTNPAGLGFYKTREIVITPGLIFNNNKANFRGSNTSGISKSGFDLGTSGIVIGFNAPYSKWTSQAFSFGVNQTANFNNLVSYSGKNNYSSYSEKFAEEISKSGESLDYFLNKNTPYAFGSSLAVFTYLVDTFHTAGNGLVIKGLPEFLLEKGIALNQEKRIETKGGIYEIGLGYAANMEDKIYLGLGLGIPIVNYQRNSFTKESDPSGDKNNNFDYSTYTESLSTKGVGVNLKLGLIYKPAVHWRLGLTIHSPTFYSLTDKQTTNMETQTEGYAGLQTVSSNTFTDNLPGETNYTATTPWKAMISGSYVFNEVSDTRKQKAFITADAEYVGYSGGRFNATGNNVTDADINYYNSLKSVIKDSYKGAFNFRLGGEIKFNTIMVRLGGAYYANPYKDKELSSNIIQASGGLGYRNHGIFIDLTYVHTFNKDVNFPYRLIDKANTFATQQNGRGNIVLTVGFKI